MFSTFDVLIESSLHDKSAKEFITVGWGKKETQFHGSVGKDGRRKQDVEILNVDKLDKTITCCWRGDGEFFAVNHVGANGRMFKVYNKEGSLEYTSEVCASLQVPIAWRPSGLWISKPEIKPDKYTITLFERNGLRHSELVLPFKPEEQEVVNLSWSQDSDIFLVETRRGNIHCMHFYTICNYHWYLKHYKEFKGSVICNWSQNYAEPKQLYLITNKGDHFSFKFDFVVNSSSGVSGVDESVVAVIDGSKLLLTNFKSQLVPPPIASLKVAIDVPVNIIEFLQQGNDNFDSNCFFTVDFKNVIKIYRCVFEKSINGRRLVSTNVIKEFYIDTSDDKAFTHAIWINVDNFLLAKNSTIFLCSFDSGAIIHEIAVEKTVGSIVKIDGTHFIAQLVDGSLIQMEIRCDEISILEEQLNKLPEFCETVVVTMNNETPSVYALKHIKKKLYLNSKELATEVTSFKITVDNDYLIYTTIAELKFVDIVKNDAKVVDSRRIERGSRMISLVKDKSHVIFQLPRGNLEIISPRILSFKIIKRYLKNQEYRRAFDLLRKERINLNLLIDLNPQKFLKELQMFVEQTDNIQWLNLFLTELKDEDVTITMYKFCGLVDSEQDVYDESFKPEDKVKYLCEKMLDIFLALDPLKYLLPSITCHVKNQQIESALQIIWDLKKSGAGDKDAEDALKYLLYLIDVNVLYNIALGMYDYQLVLFVAQKSQKDPKEYVPFLNELNVMDPSYAKYKIDCHLKRYSKAVQHISKLCNDNSKFEECIELIKKHQLFDAALNAFSDNKSCYQRICVIFGDHLRIKGKLLDASLLYERGGEFQQALAGARNTLDWQRCIVLGKKCDYNDFELTDLAVKLSHSLKESGRYKEASELVGRFASDDLEMLIDILVEGRLYSDAITELTIRGNHELIETHLRPKLKQHLIETTLLNETDRKFYLEQKERLLAIRDEKVRKIQDPHDDDDEMFSDTTSINSQSSRNTAKTFRSSKTRRKHERKLMNLKEGNKFEDIALVDSIWKLVQKIIDTSNQDTIKELLKNALELKLDDEARILQVNHCNYYYFFSN